MGDLVRALATLDTDSAASVARIVRSLGFSGSDANPPEHLRGAYDQRLRRPVRPEKTPEPSRRLRIPRTQPSPPELPPQLLETQWEEIAPAESPSTPDWLSEVPPLREEKTEPPPRTPLFPRLTTPAILGAAAATRRSGFDLDVDCFVENLVRGHILQKLPFKPVASLAHGIQLLLDFSESMTVFHEDLVDLRNSFQDLVGSHRCALYEFAGDPPGALAWTAPGTQKPWRPEPGRPIVLATDFGIGAPPASRDYASPRTWRQFARVAREAHSAVVAFVPLEPKRWPIGLGRRFTLIHWDSRTRAANVRRLVGPGHETNV